MPSQPNILFIISDQHRLDSAGCYGHPIVKTPHLDRLAANGVRFNHAVCQSPLCVTSRASIMTGLYPHTCRSYTNVDFELPDLPTLGSVFRSAGYVTGAIGKVHVKGETRQRDLGFDDRQMRLYTYWFEDYINAVGEEAVNRYATYRKPLPRYQTVYNPTNVGIDLPDEKMFDTLVVDRCVEFLEKHRDQRFFLWAGIEKPHPDWYAPAEYHAMYAPRQMPLPATAFESREDMPEAWYVSTRQAHCFTDDELRNCIAAYYANVTYADAKIGQLLGALDRLGLSDNTIVVYTTDHGEMLFDHGMVQKHNFFEESVRVPLIVRHPSRLPAGAVRNNTVSLLDLFPTFCQMTGIPVPAGLEGRSILPDLRGEAPDDPERASFSEFAEYGFPERMIRTRDWKYIYSQGQICQLYNLKDDPRETTNLIDRDSCRSIRGQLHDRLMDGWEIPDMRTVRFGGAWNKRELYERERQQRFGRQATESRQAMADKCPNKEN